MEEGFNEIVYLGTPNNFVIYGIKRKHIDQILATSYLFRLHSF